MAPNYECKEIRNLREIAAQVLGNFQFLLIFRRAINVGVCPMGRNFKKIWNKNFVKFYDSNF